VQRLSGNSISPEPEIEQTKLVRSAAIISEKGTPQRNNSSGLQAVDEELQEDLAHSAPSSSALSMGSLIRS
jgi:hypothetical protein